jgi:tyrosyl-tRNA synthetase
MVTPLLVGTDGQMKMSKSKGNYVGVTDAPSGPDGMFGKIMRLPDHLLENYYTLLTDLEPEDFKQAIAKNPRDAKAALAKWIISWLHNSKSADAAEAEFVKTTHGGVPEEIVDYGIPSGLHSLATILVIGKLASSKSEAYRKIDEGAVRIDGKKKTDRHVGIFVKGAGSDPPKGAPGTDIIELDRPMVIQLGNRKFMRAVPKVL